MTKPEQAVRLKLPPYAKPLLQERLAGKHPARVWVIRGDGKDRWDRRPVDAPCLCVGEDFAAGMYDWTIVAGVPVDVVWRSGEGIYDLVAELAHQTAPVTIHFVGDGTWPYEPGRAYRLSALEFLFGRWPKEAERDYLDRENEYYAAVLADIPAQENHADGERPSAA